MQSMRPHAFAAVFLLCFLAGSVAHADTGAASKISPVLLKAFRADASKRSVLVVTASGAAPDGVSTAGTKVRGVGPRAVRAAVGPAQAIKLARLPDVIAIVPDEPPVRPPLPGPQYRPELGVSGRIAPAPNTWMASDVVGARAAWAMGYTGTGVKVAVIDDRIDFGHPDLKGTQARVENPESPYYGWPIVFDPYSMWHYAQLGRGMGGYVNTLGTITEANPFIGSTRFTLPGTSRSGVYRFSSHPSYWLRWMPPSNRSCLILVADEHFPGVYDTVYMDLNKNYDFTDEKPCRRGDEIAWHDLDGDGIADLSGGMVYFIADGVNPVPGSDWLYGLGPPAAGTLVCLTGSFDKYESHGTLVASAIAAQGVIGAGEPPYRADEGGILRGTAPGARLISIGSVYAYGASMYDSILFATLGYDGLPNTGDEADIANMSFGYSNVDHDGWDALARYIAYLNFTHASRTTFLGATGNGGPGYGTVTTPASGPTVISVGASTLYGSVSYPDRIASADQILFGDIQPWSNRGPSALGACEPDVVAVGAWGTGAVPIFGDGANAWALWGGSSLACPMAAGVLATVFEAYEKERGAKPTFDVARELLMAGASDLRYPVLEQGAGQANAARSADVAAGKRAVLFPASWQVGQEACGFPGIVEAGRRSTQTFVLTNPTANTVTVELSGETHTLTSSVPIHIRAANADESPGFTGPSYLVDILPFIPPDTDLLRARAVIPYDQFSLADPAGPQMTFDNGFALAVYDWTDVNSNGLLWNDDLIPNGVVNEGELDEREINRFSYDAPAANCLEVSVADPLNRRHDGIWLGIQHYRRSDDIPGTDIRLTLDFYRRGRWPMLEVRPQRVTLGPRRRAVVRATFTSGPDTRPGIYSGAIRVAVDGARSQTVPVTACVTNPRSSRLPDALTVWGSDRMNSAYDNGAISGAFDWGWRAESGDWRGYFYTPYAAAPGSGRLLANVNWQNYPTDVDVLLFGPNADDYFSRQRPDVFGPYGMAPAGGSFPTNLGGAIWPFQTATGGSSEWVSAPLGQGTHLALLHGALSAGAAPSEYLTVNIGPVVFDPPELTVPAGVLSNSGVRITPSVYFRDGIEARAYGFSSPIVLEDQTITQNAYDSPASATWIRDVTLADAGLLEVSTSSSSPIDIDLYVLRDSNSDGVFDWQTEMVALSGDETPNEKVSIPMPAAGRYRIAVHGYRVRPSPSKFSIRIDAIQGGRIAAVAPAGRVRPGDTVEVSVISNAPASGDAIVYIGPRGAPSALSVRVRAR